MSRDRHGGYTSGAKEMTIPKVSLGSAPGAAVLDEPMWTMEQLAEFLQVSVKTIRNWRVLGGGPRGYRVGRHIRFRRTDVMQWLDEQGE